MTGPEHYARADQLEHLAIQQWEKPGQQRLAELTMQQAQVHATLALVAATAHQTGPGVDGPEMVSDYHGWDQVL